MFKLTQKRWTRRPLSNIAVVLFAAVLSLVLCFLYRSKEAEVRSYEQTYAAVPVFFKVTDLDGSRVNEPDGIDGWVIEQFTERGLKPTLAPYVGELHVRAPYYKASYNDLSVELVGISSTLVAEELTADWGGNTNWLEGYDESILASDEFVCIVPESLQEKTEIELQFTDFILFGDYAREEKFSNTFKVVGTYTDPGNQKIYCSLAAIEWVYATVKQSKPVEAIGAVLKDNKDLEALRQTVEAWFATPNPSGEPTPWGRFDFDYYPYAMDIDDTMLRTLDTDMKNTLQLNKLASAVVFVLSAGAGFLVGFLVVRSRKKEIVLMRTVGVAQISVYWELALEQLLCIAAGIALGGGYALWQPIGQLCLFGGIYMAGLSAALLVFLRINLLSAMKEEE